MKVNAHILVVDDELNICKSVKNTFKDQNYAIDMALSGEEALKMESEKSFDIIITDLMMPGVSGMDLLRTIKKKTPETIVIMITGYPSVKSAVESVKLGAFDYIPKPFTPNELRGIVARALVKKRLIEKEYQPINVKEEKIARIAVPTDLYCIPDNTWLKIENHDMVRVGVHHLLIGSIEHVKEIELPKVNDVRYQGEAIVTITDMENRLYRLWSPATGRIVEVNDMLKKNPDIILDDPYHNGWVICMVPQKLEKELKNLKMLNANEYSEV